MTIASVIIIWLGLAFLFCAAIGANMKRYRAASLGISEEEDTRRQDEAQMHYLRTGETLNVID